MTPKLRHALPALLLIGLVVLFFVLRLDQMVSFERLVEARGAMRDEVSRHGALSLAIFTALYTVVAALAVPGGVILTLVGGFLFGASVGGIAVAFAATVGSTLLFLAARTILNDFLGRRAGGVVGRIRHGFQRSAWSYMLFLRLTPFIPFWLVNIGAASAGVPLATFVWTTALGILPATFIVAYAGQNLDRIAAASQSALDACRAAGEASCTARLPWRDVLSPSILAAFAGLSLLALLPALIRAWQARGIAAAPP